MFDVEGKEIILQELQKESSNEDFWNNREKAETVMKEIGEISELLREWKGYKEEIDYLFSLIKKTLPPMTNPYTSRLGEYTEEVVPTIQQERPEILQKLARRSLPATEIYAEVAKLSKPVS